MLGIPGEDFPVFFPPTAVEARREIRPSSFLLPQVPSVRVLRSISLAPDGEEERPCSIHAVFISFFCCSVVPSR